MECYIVDNIRSSIIVLDGLLTSDVENFDYFVRTSSCDAGAIRVELYGTHTLAVVMEDADIRLGCHIPHLYCIVLRTGGNKSRIRREHCCVDPVSMRTDREHEATILELEHLKVLIIRAGKQK